MKYLQKEDKEIYSLIVLEKKRQQETLMMIPSENIASCAVEEAVGSIFGNKYGEGYPSKRYYQGNQYIDQLESLVIERAKKLFNVPEANVQAHSGSPANFAVLNALLEPGDTIMGLSLASGGHLTHGATFSATSKYFTSVQYNVDKNGFIDYGGLRELAKKHKPKVIIAGTTAYPRILDWKKFAVIAKEVGAYVLADISHIAGLIVAGVYPSPVEHVHVITTTTHKTLRGPRGALIMTTAVGLKKNPELAEKINKSIIPGIQGGPHFNTIAGIGVALKEDSKLSFKKYAAQILKNAKALAEGLENNGFDLVTHGTDSHLILVDIRSRNILGNTLADGCEAANIILNRNGIPYDPNPPFYPSGIRLGTPGITSRGMKEKEMKLIAGYLNEIAEGLKESKKKLQFSTEDEKKRVNRQNIIQKTPAIKRIQKEVKALCRRFPIRLSY